MALLSSSLPSNRKRASVGRRRKSSVFTILLLLLSHSVWNTLQCATSSSQPKNRPSSSIGQDTSLDNESSSNEFSQEGDRRHSRRVANIGMERKDVEKKQNQGQGEVVVQMCNDRLLSAIRQICGDNNFFVPNSNDNLSPDREISSLNKLVFGIANKRSVEERMLRRIPRSLANECCKKPCPLSSMERFCKDKSRMTMPSVKTQEPDSRVLSNEFEDVENVQDPEVKGQLKHSSNKESDPALLYPLLTFMQFLSRNFVYKNGNSKTPTEMEETGQIVDNLRPSNPAEREVPPPQARIQLEHSQPLRVSPSRNSGRHLLRGQQYGHKGSNPYQATSDAAGGGASFTNTAFNRQGHVGSHHRPNAVTNSGSHASDKFVNELSRKLMEDYMRRHQAQGQQQQWKPSTNVFTSTMAPDVTIIRLEPSTDDDTLFGK